MDLNYPAILDLFQEYLDPSRSVSAAFLIWYLENYYRLDSQEAIDSVCDQSGDKGIDGIFVDDHMRIIHVIQSRISQANTTVGDVNLKEFAGTLLQLSDSDSVSKLIKNAGKAQVATLIDRLEIVEKITEYELRGTFLSNINLDANGRSYLDQVTNVSFVGRDILSSTFISDQRDVPISHQVNFDVYGFQITEYTVDADSKAIIAPIRARDLVKMDGIANQAIFTHNVRGPLGSTKVNRDIAKSLRSRDLHKKFPLFHNGITVIADNINLSKERLTVSDYFVVNGCQSLMALYINQDLLTDDLYVLTKFIEVDPTSSLAKQITEFSNNQNGVGPRDFMANSAPQIRLQNEFRTCYQNEYEYAIKRGEPTSADVVISNEDAGLYLMAFDLKEPWATHRKYRVFDDRHSALFGHPRVTADRIVMLHVLREEVDRLAKEKVDNTLLGKYVLTRYLMMYIVREILEDDEQGKKLIEAPSEFMRDSETRDRFRSCIRNLLNDVIIDLNAEVEEYGEDFDYRGRLRDESWVKTLSTRIVSDHKRQVVRGRIPSFTQDWESVD